QVEAAAARLGVGAHRQSRRERATKRSGADRLHEGSACRHGASRESWGTASVSTVQSKGGCPMLRQLTLAASLLILMPPPVSAQTAKFQVEEATIEDIQAAILRRELTSTRVVQLYLSRIKAYNGTCVNQPDGVLGLGPITPIKNAHQLNALMTLNLRPAKREKLGFDPRKARSMTDRADGDPAMPDALEVAAQQDAHFASTGRLIGPLHGVVLSI